LKFGRIKHACQNSKPVLSPKKSPKGIFFIVVELIITVKRKEKVEKENKHAPGPEERVPLPRTHREFKDDQKEEDRKTPNRDRLSALLYFT
jgi:hypothetical protein